MFLVASQKDAEKDCLDEGVHQKVACDMVAGACLCMGRCTPQAKIEHHKKEMFQAGGIHQR